MGTVKGARRGRGIVWVCDVANSTQFMNSNQFVNGLENFLIRLNWAAQCAVSIAGGKYFKWTGDGFMAWFPVDLERDLGLRAKQVFEAAWHLSFVVFATRLGVEQPEKLQLRNGVTYEPDALLMRLATGKNAPIDVLGRAVVNAFRLSGIPASFPGIVADGRIVKAFLQVPNQEMGFVRRPISDEERMKYFKGERLGTRSVYVCGDRESKKRRTARTVVRGARKALIALDLPPPNTQTVAAKFTKGLLQGPGWARRAAIDTYKFAQANYAAPLRATVEALSYPEMRTAFDATDIPGQGG